MTPMMAGRSPLDRIANRRPSWTSIQKRIDHQGDGNNAKGVLQEEDDRQAQADQQVAG